MKQMKNEEIVAFKKDNKVYTLCKRCKAETFKSEDKETIVGIGWALDNGYEAIFKNETQIKEKKIVDNTTNEEKHERMWKGISNIFNTYNIEPVPLMNSEEAKEVLKKIKVNNGKTALENLVKQLKDLTQEKEVLIKQLNFALEMNKKLKNRNLIQRILNN